MARLRGRLPAGAAEKDSDGMARVDEVGNFHYLKIQRSGEQRLRRQQRIPGRVEEVHDGEAEQEYHQVNIGRKGSGWWQCWRPPGQESVVPVTMSTSENRPARTPMD